MDKLQTHYFPQCGQHCLDAQRRAKGQGGEFDSSEDCRQKASHRHQAGADSGYPPPRPPHSPRKLDVRP